jgi:K(+)-stimulated pyrophosphate-energized sodium pump
VIAPTLAVLHKDKIEANRKAKIESLTGISNAGTPTVNVDLKTISPSSGEVKGHLNESGDFVYETGNIQK